MPFFAAQLAIGAVICGSVCDTRITYGDLVVMADVAEKAEEIDVARDLALARLTGRAGKFGIGKRGEFGETASRDVFEC